nr:hypothetical protein [Armatimonas sp.]
MAEEEKPRLNFSDPNAKPALPAAQPRPTADPSAYRPHVSTAAEMESQAPPARLFLGLAAGLAVGILCAWLYALFVNATGFGFALVTAGIGWVIGLVVLIAGGRTGLAPAILSTLVAAFSLMVSRYMLVGMEIDKLIAQGRIPEQVRTAVQSDPIGITLKSFGWSPMSIVVLLVGVYGAWKLTYQAGTTVAE